ncbi:MAG: SDR family NAD(P)-dependent oxidoreductase [Nitrospirota bacterium]
MVWTYESKLSSCEMGLEITDPPDEFKEFYKTSFYKIKTSISHDAVAIIGMSCYYPGAPDLKSFWENILARRKEFRRIPDRRLPMSEYYDPDPLVPDKTYASRAAVIDGFRFDWVKWGIPKVVVDSSDVVHWLALETALRALEDAGFNRDNIPHDRSGVILGNTLTGEHSRSQYMRLRWPYVQKVITATALKKGLPSSVIDEMLVTMESYYKSAFAPITEDTLAGNLSNTIAGRICNFLDLHGGGYTVDGACSSSLIAVATAATALSNSTIDLAVAGGIDISLDTFEMVGFAKTGALTRDDMMVYDRGASGFIPGEGAGFVVLQRLEDALTHGNYVYAVLRGWGISSDGKGGLTAPKAQTQALAIRRAYGKADYGLGDVDFIEGHGTGTTAGDRAELEGIAEAMGDERGGPLRSCGFTSFKSLIGHTKAASGIGGFIKAVLAVNRRIVPPTAGCKEPNQVFQDKARWLYPVIQGEIRGQEGSLRAGISGMGFGGINCHVTVESAGAAAKHIAPSVGERELLASYQETELFVMAAESQRDMRERIAQVRGLADGISAGEMTDLSMKLASDVAADGPFRAALIARSPEDLLDCLDEAERLLKEGDVPRGKVVSDHLQRLWIGNAASRARVGFLFPGQGSQQINMARVLVERYPWAREFLDRADHWLSEEGYEGIRDHVYRPLDRALDDRQVEEWKSALSRAEIAQPAICLASLLWAKHLACLGIRPVAAGGHSLGELTAFHAAGAYDDEALLKFAAFRGRITAASGGRSGKMASLACGREQAEELLREVAGYALVANINSPAQTVISGEGPAVDRAVQAATRADIRARHLPVANAFHSRFMATASEELSRAAPIPETLSSPILKLFSSVDGREVPPKTNLKGHFSGQVTHHVDFITLVNSMREHCDILVEVGPGRVLSELVRSIADADGGACLPVEPRAGDDRSLNVLLGCFFARGGDVNWPVLFENRLVRPFVPASEREFIDNPCERLLAPADEGDIEASILNVSPSKTYPEAELEDSGLFSRQQTELIRKLIRLEMHKGGHEPRGGTEGTVEAPPQAEAPPALTHEGPPPSTVQAAAPEMLLNLVSEMTGFPASSISLSRRLLDDLNLDSIKAAQFVGRAMKLFGVQGEQIDPTSMANSSLQEIYDILLPYAEAPALQEAKSDKSSIVQTLRKADWVRDFKVAYTVQELPPPKSVDEIFEAEQAIKGRVLIVSDGEDGGLADGIRGIMSQRGAEASLLDYERLRSGAPDGHGGYDYFVFLMPKAKGEGMPDARVTRDMAARLHSIGNLITSLRTKTPKPTYCVVQFGPGDLFEAGSSLSLEAKGSAAFLCGLHLENPDERIRILEFSNAAEAAGIADKLAAELRTADRFCMAAYDGRLTRRVPTLKPISARAFRERNISWAPEDVVLATGGAKGITAECALAFARKTGVKLALVGSTTNVEDNAEIQDSLSRYREGGVEYRYYACDISDGGSVENLKEQVERDLGPITGVIHGAAVNRPRRAEEVSLGEALAEIAPKVLGAVNLCECLTESPPKLFVCFGSIIGISGMAGNAWYGFSNEILNLLLQRFKAQTGFTEVVTLAFSVWDEVGMGARMGSLPYLSKMGIHPIPKDMGVEHFLRLVEKDPGESQVAVSSRLGDLDTLWKPALQKPRDARFLEEVTYYEEAVEIESRAVLTLENDPYLKDHAFRGTHLFPAVFGVEAMAQAVSAVTGLHELDYVRLENMRLSRPITVERDGSTAILIRALVEDEPAAGAGVRVKAGITVEDEAFSGNHFEATFVLARGKDMARYSVELPGTLLDIKPQEDLYGNLLFQGKRFQRIKSIRSLNDTRCVFDTEMKSGEGFATNDPFFRDTLLQAGQLLVPDVVALPVEIEEWEMLLRRRKAGTLCVVTEMLQRGKEIILTDVTAVDEDGIVIERLRGYKTKIIEELKDAPLPADLRNPDEWDAARINLTLRSLCARTDTLRPVVSVANRSGLHEMSTAHRHDIEEELFRRAYGILKTENGGLPDGAAVSWTESGRPLVKGVEGVDVSFSHDERVCVSVVGKFSQGCDIEPLSSRSAEEWRELLGMMRAPLLERVADIDNSIDRAGYRIWCALEALKKASGTNDGDLAYEEETGDCVVFKGGGLSILTLPVRLLRGRERMLAVATKKQGTRGGGEVRKDDQVIMEDYPSRGLFVEGGPQGQKIFTCTFPLSLRDSATIGGGVYFARYFNWLGEVREEALKPIGKLIADEFFKGHFMVTNFTRTEIFGHVRNHETMEARIWIDKVFGADNSSFLLNFEWRRLTPSGEAIPVAFSQQQVSWIKTVGHGIVEQVPCPEFFLDFVRKNNFLPETDSDGPGDDLSGGQAISGELLGKTLYEGDVVGDGDLLKETVLDTAMEHSNLAQNIYYANYFEWQGSLRDRYLFEISPEQYRKMDTQGQLVCVDCKIHHLREAMPFDRIAVRMKLQKLYERGVSLFFEYFRVEPGETRHKLAYGYHTLAWVRVEGSGGYVPQDLPEIYVQHMLRRGPRDKRMLAE